GPLAVRDVSADSSSPKGTRTDRVLVRGKLSNSLSSVALLHSSKVLHGVKGTRWSTLTVPAGKSASSFVTELLSDLGVADAQLALGTKPPEGDGSTLPAGGLLLASQIPTQSELERVGGPAATNRETGEGVVVAVVDTGILDIAGVHNHFTLTG